MDAWLSDARDAIAKEAGLEPAELDLSSAEVGTLLRLARSAAHDSGDRTNAPLVCYLAGLTGLRGDDLDRLVAAATRSTS